MSKLSLFSAPKLYIDACVHAPEGQMPMVYVGDADTIGKMSAPLQHSLSRNLGEGANPVYLPRMQTFLSMLELALNHYDVDAVATGYTVGKLDTVLFPQTPEATKNSFDYASVCVHHAHLSEREILNALKNAGEELSRYLNYMFSRLDSSKSASLEEAGLTEERLQRMHAVLGIYVGQMARQTEQEIKYRTQGDLSKKDFLTLAALRGEADRFRGIFTIPSTTRSN